MPTITITENSSGGTHSGTEDTYLRETAPAANQDSQGLNVFSYATGDRGNALLRFTLPGVLSGATINAVTLSLCLTDRTANKTLDLHRVLRAWTETGATWNKFDGTSDWTAAGGTGSGDISASASASVLVTASALFYQDFSAAGLAADVQAWVGGAANHGWLVKRNDYTAYDGHYMIFGRSEGADGQRPKLIIDYTAGASSAFTAGAALGAVVASGSLQSVMSGFTAGATLGAVVAGGSLGATPGTFVLGPIKVNGVVAASAALDWVRIYSDAGILLYERTGGSLDASGNTTLTTAAAPPGTAVRIDWQLSSGRRRMPRVTMG